MVCRMVEHERHINKLTKKKNVAIYNYFGEMGRRKTVWVYNIIPYNMLNANYEVEIQTIYASVSLSVLYFLFRFVYSGITQTPLPPHSLRFHLWEYTSYTE